MGDCALFSNIYYNREHDGWGSFLLLSMSVVTNGLKVSFSLGFVIAEESCCINSSVSSELLYVWIVSMTAESNNLFSATVRSNAEVPACRRFT